MRNALRGAWSPPGYLLFVRESALFAQRMNPRTLQLEGEPVSVAQDVTANELNGRANFAVSENGVLVYRSRVGFRPRELAWYDRAGKRLSAVAKPGEYTSVTLSPDEKNAALTVSAETGGADTWIMDLASGVLTRMTLDSRSSTGPWSPDSQRMAVNHPGGGISEVTVASGKTRILAPAPAFANDWSADGGSILCTDAPGNAHRLSVLPLTGETGLRTIPDTVYRQRDFRFSPDGQWVAYSSDESGRFEISVARFPSFAEKRQVSSGGGGTSFWRKDGREILYVASDGTLMSAEIKTGQRIEVSTPKPLFQIPSKGEEAGADVAATRDGKRFLVLESDQANQETQIVVVLNWAAELKQR